MENIAFKQIAQFQYSSEAYIIKGKLESENIEVYIRDNYTVDSDPLVSNAIGGVKLFVSSDDFEKAQSILSQISKYSLDDNGNKITCPKCNSDHVEMITSITDKKSLFHFLLSLLFMVLPLYNKYKYLCNDCKTEF